MTADTDIDLLAGEYVLGSLSESERAAVTIRLGREPALAEAVARWERRLAPMVLREPGISPPATALPSILAEIAQDIAEDRNRDMVVHLARRARQWRGAALTMAAGLAVLVISVGEHLGWQLPGATQTLVAVLDKPVANPAADEPDIATGPVFLATMRAGSGVLEIRQVAGRRPPAGKTYVVWLKEPDGTGAVLLGPLDRTMRSTSLPLPGAAIEPRHSRAVAVSVENEGTIRGPTNPFISIGKFEGNSR